MQNQQELYPNFKSEYDQFIGIYTGLFTSEYCDAVIDHFKYVKSMGHTMDRSNHGAQAHEIQDEQYYTHEEFDSSIRTRNSQINNMYYAGLDRCLEDYIQKYSSLKIGQQVKIFANKIQETKVGGGFHAWHSENSRMDNDHRVLAVMVYLNDVQNGGETEFLYQHKRVQPKKGTVVMWPAHFTHLHRGNPPLSNTKYIMTGWYEYA
jgi:hypothetical protein